MFSHRLFTLLQYLGQHRTKIVRVLRSQIFCQIVQRGRRKAVALQGRIVQYDEKYASKTCTKSNKWSLCGVALIFSPQTPPPFSGKNLSVEPEISEQQVVVVHRAEHVSAAAADYFIDILPCLAVELLLVVNDVGSAQREAV